MLVLRSGRLRVLWRPGRWVPHLYVLARDGTPWHFRVLRDILPQPWHWVWFWGRFEPLRP